MTPKEKAIELYNKFRNENSVMTSNIRAKKQTFICLDEIIKSYNTKNLIYTKEVIYWNEVKEELSKLQ